MPDSQLITFDSLSEQSSYIKVIGVGGGGNNAVNHMFRKGISGVDFIVCNTDMKALKGSPVPDKLVLGHEGLGVGGRPAKARKAAEEKESEIKALFEKDTKMVFITAGMGGGTGTGAAPVIARMAKEIKLEAEDSDDPTQILVVAVVTTPFLFEGFRRLQQAQEGVEELRKYVDSILVINNEKLRAYGDLVMTDAFAMANDVLLTAVKGIAEIITLNAYVNIDFRDVYTVMENSGTALMGIGEVGYQHFEHISDAFTIGAAARYYMTQNGIYLGAGLKFRHCEEFNDLVPGVHAGYAFFVSRTVTLEPELYFDISTKSSDYNAYGLRIGVGVYLFKDQYQLKR